MANLHPLHIPEIIYRVGSFVGLPLDSTNHSEHQRRLSPCLAVNRLWHQTLRPLYWSIFSSYYTKENEQLQDLFCRNSHLVRYATFYEEHTQPIYDFDHLHSLHISLIEPLAIKGMTQANIHLKSLHITVVNFGIARSLASILKPLVHLSRLTLLFEAKTEGLPFDQVILPLSLLPRLEILELWGRENLWPSRMDYRTLPVLTNIKHLRFDSDCEPNSPELWLPLLCPNIESMSIEKCITRTSSRACDLPDIFFDIVQESCSKLTAFIGTDHYLFPKEEVNYFREETHCRMLSTCFRSGAKVYDVVMEDFTPAICNALLAHSQTLETLRLCLRTTTIETFRTLNRVLRSCPNLKKFGLQTLDRGGNDCKKYQGLFEHPWLCLGLQEFRWSNWWYSRMSGLRFTIDDDLSCPKELTPDSVYAKIEGGLWYVKRGDDLYDHLMDAAARVVVNALVDRVFALPKARKITFLNSCIMKL